MVNQPKVVVFLLKKTKPKKNLFSGKETEGVRTSVCLRQSALLRLCLARRFMMVFVVFLSFFLLFG